MFPTRFRILLAALALIAGPSTACLAQYEDHCGPFCEGESHLRYFEPVDLDLDCMPIDRACGYVFGYDKLYWAFTGEKTLIGAPGVTDLSEVIYRRNPQDDTANLPNQLPAADQPQPYTITNGISDAPPHASFGWGDRFELGYFKDNISYTVGILKGPRVGSYEVYGFLPLDLGNPFPGEDVDGSGTANPNEGTGVIGPPPPGATVESDWLERLLAPTLNGFGSVHVNFNAPEDFFVGFRDYWQDVTDLDDDIDDDAYVVVVGPGDLDPDFPDGFPDDINGNGGTFFIFVDGLGNTLVVVDYGDLHRFNVRFNTLQVRARTESDGIELMKTHRLSNRHHMAKNQNKTIEFGYGVRYLRLSDDFRFDGITDVLGRIYTITSTENSIVGPQIRLKASRQVGKWNTSVDTRFLMGYNIQDVDQTNGFGDDLLPGSPNSPLYAQPTYTRHGLRGDDFAPVVEFRAETKYQVTASLAIKGGLNVTYIDNLTRSSQVVEYNAPDFGISQAGQQNIFMSGLSFGAEFTH